MTETAAELRNLTTAREGAEVALAKARERTRGATEQLAEANRSVEVLTEQIESAGDGQIPKLAEKRTVAQARVEALQSRLKAREREAAEAEKELDTVAAAEAEARLAALDEQLSADYTAWVREVEDVLTAAAAKAVRMHATVRTMNGLASGIHARRGGRSAYDALPFGVPQYCVDVVIEAAKTLFHREND